MWGRVVYVHVPKGASWGMRVGNDSPLASTASSKEGGSYASEPKRVNDFCYKLMTSPTANRR